MKTFIAAVALFASVAHANPIQHPAVDPDVLHELFLTSTLVQCDSTHCWDAVTNAEHRRLINHPGWVVDFDETTLEKLQLTTDQFEEYRPLVVSMMADVAKELGANTKTDF